MKKLLIIALCLLAVFAVVSCKNEPKPEPEPAIETFDVTFESQGGSAVAKATVEKDAKVAKPADPAKEDAYFFKWYKEATCENEYDFDTPVTEAITLYAKWIQVPHEVETYKIVAAKENDRFQYQWIFTDAIKEGDVISFKYKSNRVIDEYTVRPMTAKNKDDKKIADGEAIENPVADEDGWYTFSLTVPAKKTNGDDLLATDIGIGVALYIAAIEVPGEGEEPATSIEKTRVGEDYIYIKDITYKTATETKSLTMTDDNIYYGAEGKVEKISFTRLVATVGGIPEGETNNYSQDKFRLTWEDFEVNVGDVFTMTYKVKRTDPATKDRPFQFSLRDGSTKWLYEANPDALYPAYWKTISEPDLEGWVTVTYVFPPVGTEGLPSAVSYPSSFIVDFRDEYFASPSEGHEPEIVYLRSATITTPDPADPEKTITTALVLDQEATSELYSCPIIEEFFVSAAAE